MNTRLKQFIAAENISQSQFADAIKVVRASVSHVLSGRNNPGYDFIKAIMLAYPNLNMDWLILGKGKMYKSDIQPDQPVPPAHAEGSLFFDEETVPYQEEPQIITPQDHEREFSPEITYSQPLLPAKQRKASKIVIFFDDGTYQEM